MILNLTVAVLLGMAPQAAKKPAVAAKAPAKLPANVVASFNGVNITVEDLKRQLNTTMARKVVPDLIQQIVIEKQAKAAGVTVTAAELAAKVKDEKAKVVAQMAQNTGAPMEFAQITREFGLTEAEITQTVRLNLLARKTFEKAIAKEVKGLEGQVKLSHILLATVPLGPTPEAQAPLTPEQQKKKDEDQKARVDQTLADIKAGKIKFEDAAKQFSDDKGSGSQGGELPWSGPGTFVPEFEKASFALQKAGDISVPVKSTFGWHIIKLVQKGVDASPAEKAKYKKEQVDQRLNQPNAVQQWLAGTARGAKITFNTNAKLFK